MKEIKAIFVDYDGTLLRSDGTVSDHTKRIIKSYINRGGRVYLNTGRVGTSAVAAAKELGLSKYVACCQGGVVYDVDSEEPAWSTTIEGDLAIEITSWLESKGFYFQIYPITGGYYTEKYAVPYTDFYENACGKPAVILGEKVSDFIRREKVGLVKILVVFDGEVDEPFKRELFALYGDRISTSVSRANPTYFEINNPLNSKGNALLRIAEAEGLDVENCAAFGDQGNDASMVKCAGVGVAVANATDELKAVADYVTSSNDDDGVAEFIEKFCLGEGL